MVYHLGKVKLPQLTCPIRDTSRGMVRIGGDGGDVTAADAVLYNDGVMLHWTKLHTTRTDLSPAAQVELVQEIVYASFESIGQETFRKQRRRYPRENDIELRCLSGDRVLRELDT